MLILACVTLSGCTDTKKINTYTTVYPVTYLLSTLYGEHANITQIYNDGDNYKNYELTDKQIDTYKNAELFVYNGTTDEKLIAKTLVNKNKNIKIIDTAYGLKVSNGTEELWLSPSNYLMLANNLKDSLEDQIGTKYVNTEIDTKFNELEKTLSQMDAEIRTIAKNAKNNNKATLVVSTNSLKFLSDYGFEVISLEEIEESSTNLNNLKNRFKNGSLSYILQGDNESKNELVNEITAQTNASVVKVCMMNTLTKEQETNNDTYITIMKDFINNLKTITNY